MILQAQAKPAEDKDPGGTASDTKDSAAILHPTVEGLVAEEKPSGEAESEPKGEVSEMPSLLLTAAGHREGIEPEEEALGAVELALATPLDAGEKAQEKASDKEPVDLGKVTEAIIVAEEKAAVLEAELESKPEEGSGGGKAPSEEGLDPSEKGGGASEEPLAPVSSGLAVGAEEETAAPSNATGKNLIRFAFNVAVLVFIRFGIGLVCCAMQF